MNIFAKILSHGFALAVVALLAIGLIYRGELFPDWELPEFLTFESATDDGSDAATGTVDRDASQQTDVAESGDSTSAQATQDVSQLVSGQEAASMPDAPATDVIDEPPVAEEAVTEPAAPAAAEVLPEGVPDMASEAVDTAPSTPDDTLQTLPAGPGAAEQPAADVDTVTGTSGGDTPAISQEAETAAPVSVVKTGSAYEMLAVAREAYWLRDYDKAEQYYQGLISLQPDNPDGHGELGNMYFSQGKWAQASGAYFEAGKRLADEGLVDQARQLIYVIKGLQGTQAEALEQYIDSTGSSTN